MSPEEWQLKLDQFPPTVPLLGLINLKIRETGDIGVYCSRREFS